jgi:hypothetical protein
LYFTLLKQLLLAGGYSEKVDETIKFLCSLGTRLQSEPANATIVAKTMEEVVKFTSTQPLSNVSIST